MAEPAPNSVAKGAEERRRQPRKSATNLSLVTVEMDPNGFGLMLDVSEGGAGVQVMNRIEPGTNVQIAFKLPDVESQIEGSGVITWCNGDGRVGVKFQQLKGQGSHQLKQWLDSLPESVVQDATASDGNRGFDAAEKFRAIRAELTALNLDPDSALQFILEKMIAQTNSSGGAIAIGERDRIVCRASAGLAPDVGVVIGTGSVLTAECLRTGKIVRCEDTEIDVRVDENICRELNLRSSVIVPILSQARVRGVLEAFSPEPNAFNDQHVSLLEQCAELASQIAFGSKIEHTAPPVELPQPQPKSEPVVEIGKPAPLASPERPALPEKPAAIKQSPVTPARTIAVVPPATPRPGLEKSGPTKPGRRQKPAQRPMLTTILGPESHIGEEPRNNRSKLAVLFVIAVLILVMAGLGWLYKAFASRPSGAATTVPAAVPVTQQVAQPPATATIPAPPATTTASAPLVSPLSAPLSTRVGPPPSAVKSMVADDTVQSRNMKNDQASVLMLPETKPVRHDNSVVEAPSISVAFNDVRGGIDLPGTTATPQLLASQGAVTGGRLLYRVEPTYPQFAKQQRVQGRVVLSARITKDGMVEQLKQISGSPVLEQAAIAAVRQWKYEPYKLNGQPQDVDITITIQFRLK
jgi:protein TonB